ncbi:hypothetical protein P691DRAFT_791149 [Macrolepiota fuliginosa MF-IS2]|uniref:Uncharacterized protein n=1 Tax=Macrolepiota fuliginosa MF-IS2 TaxID=1400762 RepID=A0A9P5XEV1_9AGAR|nr:hypothetical protein P691DRAFT_791149 [Macrolepiota fuliginosa MF-IS2]
MYSHRPRQGLGCGVAAPKIPSLVVDLELSPAKSLDRGADVTWYRWPASALKHDPNGLSADDQCSRGIAKSKSKFAVANYSLVSRAEYIGIVIRACVLGVISSYTIPLGMEYSTHPIVLTYVPEQVPILASLCSIYAPASITNIRGSIFQMPLPRTPGMDSLPLPSSDSATASVGHQPTNNDYPFNIRVALTSAQRTALQPIVLVSPVHVHMPTAHI